MINIRTEHILPIGHMAMKLQIESKWLRAEVEAGRIPSVLAGGRRFVHPPTVERILGEMAQVAKPKTETREA